MARTFKLRLNRDDLAKFLPNQRSIRAFENLFDAIPTFTSSHLFNCNSTLSTGDVVYIDGPNNLGKANATSLSTAKAIGVVGFKPTENTCEIVNNGEATGFTGLVVGSAYFLSKTAGHITDIPVTDSGAVNLKIGYALTETSLWVSIDNIIIRS